MYWEYSQNISYDRKSSEKIFSSQKVQPYVPSTSVLYLGMDEDKKDGGASRNEQFGEGWERDPNRINPHLQVILHNVCQ